MKQKRIKWILVQFIVNFNIIDISNITNYNKKIQYKIMFGLIKKCFSGSVVRMANSSNLITYIFLNNQPCMTAPTHIDLNPNEYN